MRNDVEFLRMVDESLGGVRSGPKIAGPILFIRFISLK
jgi:hypothetical protein